jgi:UbiD family decarboxylase
LDLEDKMFEDLRGFVEHLKQQGEVTEIDEELSVRYEMGAAIKLIAEKDGSVALFNIILSISA